MSTASDSTGPVAGPAGCPYCQAPGPTKIASFGTSVTQSQWYCERCHSVFEYWRAGGAPSDRDEEGEDE